MPDGRHLADPDPQQQALRLANQAALAAARLESHRRRCSTCSRGTGVYAGLCVLGSGLRRELEAARELSKRHPLSR